MDVIWPWFASLVLCAPLACDSDSADQTPMASDSLTGMAPTSGAGAGSSSTTGAGSTTGDAGASGGAEDMDTTEAEPMPPVVFDLGVTPDAGDISLCGAPSPTVCDDMDGDPWHAIGLNCPGGPSVDGAFEGETVQLHVHTGNFGTSNPAAFPPREGSKMVILSSDDATQLASPNFGDLSVSHGNGPLNDLPPPLTKVAVSATETCADNPALVGAGDCSNTIEEQFDQGGDANDFAAMWFSAEVPAETFGFTYDFAFFSVEYPQYYQTSFNDMYVAWLESEAWTGNISFDEAGAPISLNAGFLDYKDAPNLTGDCPAPCQAPELAGTALVGHAGTKWLTTNAPVVPGETIEVYFAIFDIADTILDSAVMLDNFLWTCEGGPPVTIPG